MGSATEGQITDSASELYSPKRIWRFSAHDVAAVESLAQRCHLSPVVARLLLERNITTPDQVAAFLKPKLNDLRPPAALPGVTQATEVIMTALRESQPMVVYGDYDADGMTGTSILYLMLKRLGANVVYHLPSRAEEGYGLHAEIVERLAQHGKRLIITVDCGIASLEAASKCRELGVQLVITDHHGFGQQLPDAHAIVHPALPVRVIHSLVYAARVWLSSSPGHWLKRQPVAIKSIHRCAACCCNCWDWPRLAL